MAPTLSQINLAKEDPGLRARVLLAAEAAGHSYSSVESALTRIIVADTKDDGGGATTIAGAYDYQWGAALRELAESGVPSRATVQYRLAQVGVDPRYITDGTIERAVRATLPDTPPTA